MTCIYAGNAAHSYLFTNFHTGRLLEISGGHAADLITPEGLLCEGAASALPYHSMPGCQPHHMAIYRGCRLLHASQGDRVQSALQWGVGMLCHLLCEHQV